MGTFQKKKNEVIVFCDCGKFQHKLYVEDGEMQIESKKIGPQKPEETIEQKTVPKKKSLMDEFFGESETEGD